MTPLDPAVADEIFEALVEGYDLMPSDQSTPFLARLCLLLGCSIGEPAKVREAVRHARRDQSISAGTEEVRR